MRRLPLAVALAAAATLAVVWPQVVLSSRFYGWHIVLINKTVPLANCTSEQIAPDIVITKCPVRLQDRPLDIFLQLPDSVNATFLNKELVALCHERLTGELGLVQHCCWLANNRFVVEWNETHVRIRGLTIC